MFLIILLIYFIILIIIEVYFTFINNKNNKQIINIKKIDNLSELFDNLEEKNKTQQNKSKNNLICNINNTSNSNYLLKSSNSDVIIDNYVGKFYLKDNYGFFSSLDNWNLLRSKYLYEFNAPVNIKIININLDENIEYYIDK